MEYWKEMKILIYFVVFICGEENESFRPCDLQIKQINIQTKEIYKERNMSGNVKTKRERERSRERCFEWNNNIKQSIHTTHKINKNSTFTMGVLRNLLATWAAMLNMGEPLCQRHLNYTDGEVLGKGLVILKCG